MLASHPVTCQGTWNSGVRGRHGDPGEARGAPAIASPGTAQRPRRGSLRPQPSPTPSLRPCPDPACWSLATSPRRAENQRCWEGTALCTLAWRPGAQALAGGECPAEAPGPPRQPPPLPQALGGVGTEHRPPACEGPLCPACPPGPQGQPALRFCLRQPVGSVTCHQHQCPPAPLPSPQASCESPSAPLPRPGLQLPVRLSVLPTVGRSEPRLWCVNSFIYPTVHLPSRSAIHPSTHPPIYPSIHPPTYPSPHLVPPMH